jgi:hypothetical protein
VRYERDRPGELVHLDVKKLGRIPHGGGWRTRGRPGTKTWAAKTARIGFDYVHAAIDDCSRLAYAEILPDEKGTTAAAFLARAAAHFAAAGIPSIERVMTGNAFAYRHSTAFRDAVTALGARQKFIRPHCPGKTGKQSGSTAPWPSNGPTASPSPATTSAPPPSSPGQSSTTPNDSTPPSKAAHPPADCHQPDSQVQLAGVAPL